MKLPVTVDELRDMWIKDSTIDSTEPGRELLRIPSIHSKYLSILMHHNLLIRKIKVDYAKKKKLKYEYYHGILNDPEELKKLGPDTKPWVQKSLKTDIGPIYLEGDDDLTDIQLRLSMHEEITSFCQGVIKELNNRTWQLKSYIDWEKFTHGN